MAAHAVKVTEAGAYRADKHSIKSTSGGRVIPVFQSSADSGRHADRQQVCRQAGAKPLTLADA